MSELNSSVDIWNLFIHGESHGLKFGDTNPDGFAKHYGIRGKGFAGDGLGYSWLIETQAADIYFQGYPPQLLSLRIKVAQDDTPARMGNTSPPRIGGVEILFDDSPFSGFSTMQLLLQNFEAANKLRASSSDNKQIEFNLIENERWLAFGYALETRLVLSGDIETDYFLRSVWLRDYSIEERLLASLPADLTTRKDFIEKPFGNAPKKDLTASIDPDDLI